MSFTLVCILVASICFKNNNNNLGSDKPSLHTENSSEHLPKSTVTVNVIVPSKTSIWGTFLLRGPGKMVGSLPSSCSISLLIEALFEVDSGPC